LINITPIDPSTIPTAMCEIETVSKKAAQKVSVFTCDQQLYKVTINIMWDDPVIWKNFYPRIDGMHWVMCFVGCIGKLMQNSGIDLLMKAAFAGVDSMLVGKKFPMNTRALRIVVVELLRMLIDKTTTQDDLNETLQVLQKDSQLAEHWITNLIYPVFLIMLYVRAEREGEFSIDPSHWNYARDSIVYLCTIEKLPNCLHGKFMNGEHIVRLRDGDFNGI